MATYFVDSDSESDDEYNTGIIMKYQDYVDIIMVIIKIN